MMPNERLRYLLHQWIAGVSNLQEENEMAELFRDGRADEMEQIIQEMMAATPVSVLRSSDSYKHMVDAILRVDQGTIQDVKPRKDVVWMQRRRGWKMAAAAILLLVAGVWFWLWDKKNEQSAMIADQIHRIEPGSEGAVLTLADGTDVLLDSLESGTVIPLQQGIHATIVDGELIYDQTNGSSGEVSHNTLTTPKGRQFQVMLPDRTKVWLNAASSIRFPSAFTGKERQVAITGEVYFEVARNTALPFKVTINETVEVEALGTSFNVNAYTNEPGVSTTLFDGAVRVSWMKNDHQGQVLSVAPPVVLSPGQQANIPVAGGKFEAIAVSQVRTEKVLAWKNALFDFDGLSLEELMRQVERWYDIEVVYENKIPQREFIGSMNRQISLEGLLKNLEVTGVRYRLEANRRLVILPDQ